VGVDVGSDVGVAVAVEVGSAVAVEVGSAVDVTVGLSVGRGVPGSVQPARANASTAPSVMIVGFMTLFSFG
jgi:hypothetical protein